MQVMADHTPALCQTAARIVADALQRARDLTGHVH
jgi:glycine C-acetyltransferase/8-amino-7-oxononanoate synthase